MASAPDYSFMAARPTDLRGLVKQIDQLISATRELRTDHDDAPPDPMRDEWFVIRNRFTTWGRIVVPANRP